MEVNKVLMKGLCAKHIERRNIFHSNDVHWKLLVVKLQGQPVIKIRNAEDPNSKNSKRFSIHTVTAIKIFENDAVRKRQLEK